MEFAASDGAPRTLGVLIAEEKNFIAARLEAQIESLGHRVLCVVKDGPAAAESARQSQPDLILLDQRIPPLDGIETAREILTRHIAPIILLIGYPAAGLVRRAQEVGILSFLVWPADAAALESSISVALNRFREFRVLCEQSGGFGEALRARMAVEQAKKLLVRRLEQGEADAFRYLHRQSSSTGTPLGEVAARLVRAEEVWFGKPGVAKYVDTILRVLARREVSGPRGSPEMS